VTEILVVEDDSAIAVGLQDDLTLEGYSVEVVTAGDVAVKRAREKQFSLILLDVMLPRKDGFEVCRELRRTGVTSGIVLLTAKTEESDKVLGLEVGADDYITKPFSSRELRSRVKAVLRRCIPQQAAALRFDDVEIDLGRCEVFRNGARIELTLTEFKMLCALVRAKGSALSRDQLIGEIWGNGTFLTDRVIDNHVMNLRRKLDQNSINSRHIVSVRGLGYRFDG
jgi:DNA-binding response OmpR family regulator